MKILITGFEPFAGSAINPSQLLIKAFETQHKVNDNLYTCLLPVDTNNAPIKLIDSLDFYQPDAVVCLGQATGRALISLEKVAINLLNFRIPDNQGNKIEDQPIVQDAPVAYFSTLPIHKLHQAITASGIPCEVSYSAGTYLCNQVFYILMHHIASNGLLTMAGFVHLPALPEQVVGQGRDCPSMSLNIMRMAVDRIISTLNTNLFS